MEKLVYLLWKPDSATHDGFRDSVIANLTPALLSLGARHLRCNIVDSAVAQAHALRIENLRPVPDAMLSFWMNTAIHRKPLEDAINSHCARACGYLVTESEPMPNCRHMPAIGQRTFGMNEVVLLQRPPRLAYEDWIRIWHHSHTQVAIETQSSFGYRQNVVVRPLTYGAPAIDAIVEENFPPEAMTDRMAFYDSTGNETQYREREKRMIDSCRRFIDFDRMDCLPMSEYNFN